jgi:3D (Asp-Asp-Asp) domain-containing protein
LIQLDRAFGKNINKELTLKIKLAAVSMALMIFAAAVTVGLSMAFQKPQHFSSSESAKVDEPINPDKSVQEYEPVKNLIQCDELINVGEPNKDEGEKEQVGQESKILARIEVIPSGYYTPERGQPRYATGSFEGDIALNGRGKKTASGTKPEKGRTIAADKRILPEGTKVRIEGYPGIYVVEDKGGGIKGYKVDIYTGRGYQGLKEAMKLRKRDKRGKIIKLVIEVVEYPRNPASDSRPTRKT